MKVRTSLAFYLLAIFLLAAMPAGAAYTQTAQPQSQTNSGPAQSQVQTPQTQPQPDQPQPPAGEGAGGVPETIISPKEAKELFRSVDEILQFASHDTDLPIKHRVKRKLAKRDQVQAYVEKSMKDDKDAKRLERSSEVLKKFGLIPRDFELSKFLVAMLREQVAGYYDVKTKTVNLLNWLDVEQQKPVLAHELTHALQDQSFGIEKWVKGSRQDADNKNDTPSPDAVSYTHLDWG